MSAASRIELARIMAEGLTVKDAAKQARLRVGYRGLRPTSASALADLLANGHDVGIAQATHGDTIDWRARQMSDRRADDEDESRPPWKGFCPKVWCPH
ncbi:MAG: hypothetical protein M3Y77_08055 [Actinomycetota bacterium]|nr:hypothetical protein [Actinomycetota bacterium]